MLRGMDRWTFGGADAFIASTWFGLRHARLKVVVLQRTVVSRFGCFVSEFWVLHFRVLGAPFSSFWYFVFEIWVLCASLFVFESFGCFVFESWVHHFRVFGASFSRFGCFVLRSSFSSASFSKLPGETLQGFHIIKRQ